MKILFSSIVDLYKSPHYSRLHKFVEYMVEKHEVVVTSINDTWKGKKDNKANDYREFADEILKNIEYVYTTKRQISPIIQEALSSFFLAEKIDYNEIDIHFNYNSMVLGNSVTRSMIKRKKPTIFDVADDLTEMVRTSPQIPNILKPIGYRYSKFFFNDNLKRSNIITYTTKSLAKSLNVPDTKLSFLSNGVDTNRFKPIKVDRETYGLKKESMVVGFVGVLREWVDLSKPLLAFKKIREIDDNIEFLVVGGGPEYDYWCNFIKDNKILGVKMIGTIPYPLIPDYINLMDICLIPFKDNLVSDNSLPLKLFEYLACDKIVISSNITGIKDTIGDRVFYSSEIQDYIDIISGIDGKYERKTGNREFVVKNFEWKKICKNLENIMTHLVGE